MQINASIPSSLSSDPADRSSSRTFDALAATLTKGEVAVRLGVCTKTIENWCSNASKGFPSPVNGTGPVHGRWASSEIAAWQREHSLLGSDRPAEPGNPAPANMDVLAPVMTKADVAALFRVTTRTLDNWRAVGTMGFPAPCNPGGHPRWARDDVLAWRGGVSKPDGTHSMVPASTSDEPPRLADQAKATMVDHVSPTILDQAEDCLTLESVQDKQRGSASSPPETVHSGACLAAQGAAQPRASASRRLDRLAGRA